MFSLFRVNDSLRTCPPRMSRRLASNTTPERGSACDQSTWDVSILWLVVLCLRTGGHTGDDPPQVPCNRRTLVAVLTPPRGTPHERTASLRNSGCDLLNGQYWLECGVACATPTQTSWNLLWWAAWWCTLRLPKWWCCECCETFQRRSDSWNVDCQKKKELDHKIDCQEQVGKSESWKLLQSREREGHGCASKTGKHGGRQLHVSSWSYCLCQQTGCDRVSFGAISSSCHQPEACTAWCSCAQKGKPLSVRMKSTSCQQVLRKSCWTCLLSIESPVALQRLAMCLAESFPCNLFSRFYFRARTLPSFSNSVVVFCTRTWLCHWRCQCGEGLADKLSTLEHTKWCL